jgi:hypothetical protein
MFLILGWLNHDLADGDRMNLYNHICPNCTHRWAEGDIGDPMINAIELEWKLCGECVRKKQQSMDSHDNHP